MLLEQRSGGSRLVQGPDMSFTRPSDHTRKHRSAIAKPRVTAKAIKSIWEIDKVTALAILAASAIFAPVAVAILNQAAQIFAH